ncbi:epidermal retinol dehydrogenase 2-like [Pseudomyrmex gracilis]|uniref:epidermal retinol dehydrogenase 2-like n=1 Tax=Pseudomyrmex gracilis TaxID=219809 RepID=UPI000995C15B|nr:epidermal retinol dehydrogenase 2-like [Pseudomyrmex gracilis]XP_020289503.1 epidermal retinol dehydrogenase 2-like [Pseudomyrmex gracilis]XP_020289505.1 epidermal retinol dehydrogenase 2-like [Pseudomyrmex gracilis]XP_020289506.1 epidermal retinol dehydrogenase 2-like [Pseudomyrmex gracilis]XP_020289507.1 epidermal retinol dehydrogenase 2-like [Pseudomyrmex gracilis]
MYQIVFLVTDILWLILQIFHSICESVFNSIFSFKKNVANEIVLITGTGHGIGKELAIQYARLGARVVCLDVNQETNKNTVEEIKLTVKNLKENAVYAYHCDISNRDNVFEVAKKVRTDVGDVTILINNAGIMPCRAFLDHTTDQIRQIFDINVLSHFWMLQAYLPNMIKNNHGHVVALSSIAGLSGVPYLVPYCSAKYAVRGLMNTINEELRIQTENKSLIKFTTIFPYMVNTGLCKKPKVNERLSWVMNIKQPADIAAEIIAAQRQDVFEKSIPFYWLSIAAILNCLPVKTTNYMKDFLASGVEPDN